MNNTYGVFLGFGMGWILYGLVNLVFSSKRLTRKLEKRLSEYEIEESCRKILLIRILAMVALSLWAWFAPYEKLIESTIGLFFVFSLESYLSK